MMSQVKEFQARFKPKLEHEDLTYTMFLPFLNQNSYTAKEYNGIVTVYVPNVDILGISAVEHVRYTKEAFSRIFEVI